MGAEAADVRVTLSFGELLAGAGGSLGTTGAGFVDGSVMAPTGRGAGLAGSVAGGTWVVVGVVGTWVVVGVVVLIDGSTVTLLGLCD